MRFEPQKFRMTRIDNRTRPRLKRNVIDVDGRIERGPWFVTVGVDDEAAIALPDAFFTGSRSEIDSSIRPARSRRLRRALPESRQDKRRGNDAYHYCSH